ncbi:uncharacterized protein LOC143026815 [Oratosquilla oratoria]|uniref:uncharacterized protein LOC143026815 n=1 Tax=Oratosquilla oratoria TaxID=337810 RepID=UPI003F760969
MKKFRTWMKLRTPESRLEYVMARNEAEAIKRRAKSEFWESFGQELENYFEQGKKLIAKNYRKGNNEQNSSMNNNDGELLLDPSEIRDRWTNYFTELLNKEVIPNENGNELIYMNVEEEDEFEEITTEEIEYALKKMKNNKSPGCDELAVELLKQGGQEIKMYLKNIFNHAWNEGAIPEEWNNALICPIFKKGNKRECRNYRGISLLTHIGKVYERVLERRLRHLVEDRLSEWQCGFRPNRGTIDLIFGKCAKRKNVESTVENVNRVEDRVVTLVYADDVALASQNLEELQKSLNRWNNALNEYGLRLNIEKCEVMTVSREEMTTTIGDKWSDHQPWTLAAPARQPRILAAPACPPALDSRRPCPPAPDPSLLVQPDPARPACPALPPRPAVQPGPADPVSPGLHAAPACPAPPRHPGLAAQPSPTTPASPPHQRAQSRPGEPSPAVPGCPAR